MAVVWTDLTTPTGELDGAILFSESGATLQTRLEGYIADGEAKVGADLTGDDLDAAVTLWAEYRAYLAKYQLELSKHAQKQLVNQGSATKLETQITGWLALAQAKLAEFNDALPPDETAASASPSTTSTPIVYVW
jgi:hypothetical protein